MSTYFVLSHTEPVVLASTFSCLVFVLVYFRLTKVAASYVLSISAYLLSIRVVAYLQLFASIHAFSMISVRDTRIAGSEPIIDCLAHNFSRSFAISFPLISLFPGIQHLHCPLYGQVIQCGVAF